MSVFGKVPYKNHARRHLPGGSDPLPLIDPVYTVGASIVRDGLASTIAVSSHTLNQTTTLIDDYTDVEWNYGMTVDLADGTIEAPTDGIYLFNGNIVWTNGVYGACMSYSYHGSGPTSVAPIDCTYVFASETTYHNASWLIPLQAGDLTAMLAGQNSGSDKDVIIATFQLVRVGNLEAI